MRVVGVDQLEHVQMVQNKVLLLAINVMVMHGFIKLLILVLNVFQWQVAKLVFSGKLIVFGVKVLENVENGVQLLDVQQQQLVHVMFTILARSVLLIQIVYGAMVTWLVWMLNL
jgi:hypothetical protein